MNVIETDLKDYPSDIQELLRQRAVRQCRPISDVIKGFAIETSLRVLGSPTLASSDDEYTEESRNDG